MREPVRSVAVPAAFAAAVALCLGPAAAPRSAAAATPSAAEILAMVDKQVSYSKDRTIEGEMVLIDVKGEERVRKLRIMEKGTDKRVIRFLSGDLKGMAVLALGAKTMYIYMPGGDRVRRVGMHAASKEFQGSDFTNDDMATINYAPHYDAKFVSEDAKEWVLDLRPKPGVPSAWVRTRMFVDKVHHFIDRMDFFDALDPKNPAKTETRSGVKKFGDYWNQTLITMKNNRTGHRSELRFFDFKVNTGLDDGLFTPRALMRGR